MEGYLAGWLGFGQAIAEVGQQHSDIIQDMLTNWPYFRARVSLTEMVYLKSDTDISKLYDQSLVEPYLQPLGEKLRAQLTADKATLLALLGQNVRK